jgi:LysR family nitrogen assimilation transcriptional regulator
MTSRTDKPDRSDQRVIDSRRLLYFYHVAKSGRFTAAEAVLDVAQSAISRQIQQLETDLEVQLLERTGHGVKLTTFGDILYRRAEALLKAMEATVDEIEEARHAPIENVSIAAPPSFMATYMADALLDFSDRRPNARVRVVEASTGAVYNHLADGQVDIAVVLQAPNTSRLQLRELVREPLLVVARGDHPIAGQKFVPRAQLGELELVVPASLNGSRSILREYFSAEGFSVRSNQEIDSLPLTKELIRRKPFCTILPQITCEQEIAAGEFVARPLKPPLYRTLHLAHLRDIDLTPALTDMIDCVVRSVAARGRAD